VETGAETKNCAGGILTGVADKIGLADEASDAATGSAGRSSPELTSPWTVPVCAAVVFPALPALSGGAATTCIPSTLATAGACPPAAPDFFRPDALAVSWLAALVLFPPADGLAAAAMFVDGKTARPKAAVAAGAPATWRMSTSPNDAAGEAAAAGIAGTAAVGPAAMTGTGAINPSASDSRMEQAGRVPTVRCPQEIGAGGETAQPQGFCRRADRTKER